MMEVYIDCECINIGKNLLSPTLYDYEADLLFVIQCQLVSLCIRTTVHGSYYVSI